MEMGLSNKLVSVDKVDAKTSAYARKLAAKGPTKDI